MDEEALALSLGRPSRSGAYWRSLDFLRRLMRVRMAAPALAIVLLIVFCAIYTFFVPKPWLFDTTWPLQDPVKQDPFHGLQGASWSHPLGTDQLGRDSLSRLIYGSQIALAVGFGAVGFGVAVGMPIGIFSGYLRGFPDAVLMRLMDAIISFPGLVLALALVAARGASLTNVIFAIGIANIPFIARVTRGQALAVREQEYILAAQSTGASPLRIMFRHVMPNTLAPVIVQSTLGMAFAVLAEAALSFLGVGVPPSTASWGSDLQFAFGFMSHQPLVAIVPGAAIFLLVLSFNLLGDGLRDVLDPRLRGSI